MDNQPPSEQLEEGEIVDDDVFEDISDNSIIEQTFGKLASSNENLRALSLSSGNEKELYKNAKLKRKLLYRKTRIKQQRKRKKRRLSVETSETDSQCEDLKEKLKEAIHISGIENNCKNTLEIRLKAMGGLGKNATPDAESPSPAENDNLDTSDKIDDNEIEKLRIEALRTAVMNKFKRRKRKKTLNESQNLHEKIVEAQENKENDTPKVEPEDENNTINDHNDKKQINNAIDLEEDEDVLRASLLAGLAKKITKVQQTAEIVTNGKSAPPKLPPPVLPKKKMKNIKSCVNKIVQSRPKPQVKPLIINLNGDSDSDTEEIQQKPLDVPKVADLKIITSNVEKFLKEQRVKFETESKKRIQLVKKKENKSVLEKSAVKLLPKSQQIEYQQLLRKLKNAERQKRAKKIAQLKESQQNEQIKTNTSTIQTLTEPFADGHFSENLPQSKNEVKHNSVNETLIPDFNTEHDSKESDAERKKIGVTNELTMLQKSLKEIKLQRNGSLQIKSKYQVLTPIIRKITAASNERKKHELRIKNLSKELNEARTNLARSHQRFSALVRELVDKKETIDKSFGSIQTTEKNKQNGNNVNIIEQTSISTHRIISKKEIIVPVTSTPIKAHLDKCSIAEAAISNIVTSTTVNCYEDMDVCNSDETDIYQIDIVDPNDIDQIFKRRPVTKSTLPEYVSPLNLNSYERYRHVDPLGIMCPYEVHGSCRDLDCTFKHYLKNHDRL